MISSCIQDDFVDDFVEPVLRISTSIDTIEINTEFQFQSIYFNNIGREESVEVIWESDNPDIISIDQNGIAFANASGSANISVSYTSEDNLIQDEATVVVGENTVVNVQSVSGTIETTSFYTLEGDFEFTEEPTINGVVISVADNYVASSSLPGLYIYLSNNKNSIADAREIGFVEVYEGAHTYEIEDLGFNDFKYIVYFCKPFNIKVGEAEL